MVQETRNIGSVRLYSDLETSFLFLYRHSVWDNIMILCCVSCSSMYSIYRNSDFLVCQVS